MPVLKKKRWRWCWKLIKERGFFLSLSLSLFEENVKKRKESSNHMRYYKLRDSNTKCFWFFISIIVNKMHKRWTEMHFVFYSFEINFNFGRVILVKDLLRTRGSFPTRRSVCDVAGMVPEQADKMAEKARGRDGDGEEAARRGRGRRRRGWGRLQRRGGRGKQRNRGEEAQKGARATV